MKMKKLRSMHCSVASSKVNAEIAGRSVTSLSSAKVVQIKMVEITAETRLEEIIAPIVIRRDMLSRTASN